MNDDWMNEYERIEAQGRDIMFKINERNKFDRNSAQHVRAQGQIRSMMRQYSGEVSRLRQSLERATSQYHIGQRESDSRQKLLDALASKERQFSEAYNNTGAMNPFSSGSAARVGGPGSNPFADDDDPALDDFGNMGYDDIRQRQQQMIKEQDSGLEALSKVLGRQKQMGQDIGKELDSQNDLIDDITGHVDRTDQQLVTETRHIQQIDRKSAACCYWVIIILLLVGIIVVAVVPYKK